MSVNVGCAGWSIPKEYAEHFPQEGCGLERYSCRLPAVEINSSFYRPHRPVTYARWASSVPPHFRFAVKVPRLITHQLRLQDAAEPLDRFLSEARVLDGKLGPLLVQLPPSLAFVGGLGAAFFALLRDRYDGAVVCEPRHPSWFGLDAEAVMVQFRVARVAVDPAPVPEASRPGGWGGLVYFRLHGSPRIYYSAYSAEYVDGLIRELDAAARRVPTWCIFDNTALGAATADALRVLERLP